MPVIHFSIAELERLLGKKVPREELARTIPMIGADVDDASGEKWAIEFFPNRPDLYTVEGIARAMRAFYGFKTGLREYKVDAPKTTLYVDPSVEGVRPHIVGAFVRDVKITQERLDALIELQEDLHWGLGTRRRKVAIGVHDARRLEPPFYYLTTPPTGVSFIPLQEEREMTPDIILSAHAKGRDYAHLLEGAERYPIILDREGNVLSMPPIINGALTAVTTETTDVFLDVTGTDPWALHKCLNILATSLAESGGKIEAVTIKRMRGKMKAPAHQSGIERLQFLQHWQRDAKAWEKVGVTPDLKPEKRKLSVAETNRLLGSDFTAPQIAKALGKMGHGAKPGKTAVDVLVPAYRSDIMHAWDLIEDVAIGHGINNFKDEMPTAVTSGAPLPGAAVAEGARQLLIGHGFHEVMTLTLSSVEDQFAKMGLPRGWSVDVKNPLSEEHTLLRVSLLPSILQILRKNAHRDLPQRFFEIGTVVVEGAGRAAGASALSRGPENLGGGESGAPRAQRRVAGAIIHARANFSEAKGLALALARDLRWSQDVERAEHPAFVPGRVAALGDRGVFGELHPRTISAFGLGYPVIAFEFTLEALPKDVYSALVH